MSFDQMMAELKQDYIKSLPEKIQVLGQHFKNESVEDLRNDFHKLKGTGKTYGLPEVTELALIMERICKTKPEQLKQAMPAAIASLQEIFELRTANKPVELKSLTTAKLLLTLDTP